MENPDPKKDEKVTPLHSGRDVKPEKPAGMAAQIYFSFFYAFRGMSTAVITQRNMRFHLFATLMVMTFSLMFSFSPSRKAFLFMIVTFVVAMEVLNTCIEAFTDMASPGFHKLARVTKDTAATAVLVTALGSLMAAGYFFLPPVMKLFTTYSYIQEIAPRFAAMCVVIGSIIVFWLTRAVRFLLAPSLFVCAGAAAYGSAYLAWAERDWISMCALLYFGFFLLQAISRGRSAAAAGLGQLAGVVAFAIVFWG